MFDELRHAQLYGRLAIVYGNHHDGFDDPRPAWMAGLRLQPTRRIVEEIMATLDWGKAIILAQIVFEPPLHTAAAHALLTTGALAAGDGLTPFVCRSIEDDKVRHREGAAAFLRLVCADDRHGEHNRELITSWVADLLPPHVRRRGHTAGGARHGRGGRRRHTGAHLDSGTTVCHGHHCPSTDLRRRRGGLRMSRHVARSVVGIEMMAGEECDAIVAAVLQDVPDASVVQMPGMVLLDVPDRMVIHASAVTEHLGRDWDSRDLNQVVSAYRGYFTRWDTDQVVLSWDAEDPGDEIRV